MIAISNAISIGLNRNGSLSVDPDAQAFFDRVSAAGGNLSDVEKIAVNQLVINMKYYGVWDQVSAAYPMVGSSATSCAQNLKSNAFTGVFSSGWTYSSTGATPNGTSAYMSTGYDQSVNGDLNDSHLSYYSRTNATSGGNIGSFVLTPVPSFTHLYSKYADGKSYLGLNSAESSVVNSDARGFYLGSRISPSEIKLYRDNSVLISAVQNSTVLPTGVVVVGATRNGISGSYDYGRLECAFASIGKGLSDTQASLFRTCIQAFQTSLNRSI